jgi:hypothetical protein
MFWNMKKSKLKSQISNCDRFFVCKLHSLPQITTCTKKFKPAMLRRTMQQTLPPPTLTILPIMLTKRVQEDPCRSILLLLNTSVPESTAIGLKESKFLLRKSRSLFCLFLYPPVCLCQSSKLLLEAVASGVRHGRRQNLTWLTETYRDGKVLPQTIPQVEGCSSGLHGWKN